MSNFHAAGFLWESQPGVQSLVEQILVTKGETIRESPVKQITRHRLGPQEFYVKRYRHDAVWWRPWKFLFKRPRSHGEWRTANRLAQLNVPCVPHLAHGERRKFLTLRESVLITEAPPGYATVTKDTFTDREAQRRLGRFARAMHDRGVQHDDFIAGNLLHSAADQALCLVDLDKIKLRQSLPEAKRLHFLAQLGWWMPVPLPLSDEFYDGYGRDLQPQAAATTRRGRQLYEQVIARRAQRFPEADRNFTRRRFGPRDWWVPVSGLPPGWEAILNDPGTILAGQSEARAQGLVIKRYPPGGAIGLLPDWVCESAVMRAFRTAYHLKALRIAAPAVVAAHDGRRLGSKGPGYLVREEIPGSVALAEWQGSRPWVANQLAALLAALHNSGFKVRDLAARDFLISPAGQTFLASLDKVRFSRQTTTEQSVTNLAELVGSLPKPSRAMHCRFLRRYAAERGESDWRRWWRMVEQQLK